MTGSITRRTFLASAAVAFAATDAARVIAVEPLTHDVKRLRVRMPRDYRFEPGQFAQLALPRTFVESWNAKYGVSHRVVRRPYSFASSPKRLPAAEFIIQLAAPPAGRDLPPGIASTYIHSHLRPGDPVDIGPPLGNLGAADGVSRRPLLLIAGGTGVAPFVGLLDHWFRTKEHRDREIHLFLGVRQRRDLLLDTQFRQWAAKHRNFRYVPALSDPRPGDQWTGATGFINAVVDKHFGTPLDAVALLAGSPRMMAETVKTLRAKGVAEGLIRHDPITVVP